MKFSRTLPLLFGAFRNENIEFALIGGIALHTHGIGEDLMRRHYQRMDWKIVRAYFGMFGRTPEFNKLKKRAR